MSDYQRQIINTGILVAMQKINNDIRTIAHNVDLASKDKPMVSESIDLVEIANRVEVSIEKLNRSCDNIRRKIGSSKESRFVMKFLYTSITIKNVVEAARLFAETGDEEAVDKVASESSALDNRYINLLVEIQNI